MIILIKKDGNNMIGTVNVIFFLKQETVIHNFTKKNRVFSLPIQGKFYPKYSSIGKDFL